MTERKQAVPAAPDAVLRALADPHRRQILRLVQHTELAAGQIAASFPLTQQAVSQHLGVLTEHLRRLGRDIRAREPPFEATNDRHERGRNLCHALGDAFGVAEHEDLSVHLVRNHDRLDGTEARTGGGRHDRVV